MTQCDRILRHMRDCGSIDPITAMREYGVMRLAARIVDLRDQGHDIHAVNVAATNRYGEHVMHAVYSLREQPQQADFFNQHTQDKEHTHAYC